MTVVDKFVFTNKGSDYRSAEITVVHSVGRSLNKLTNFNFYRKAQNGRECRYSELVQARSVRRNFFLRSGDVWLLTSLIMPFFYDG